MHYTTNAVGAGRNLFIPMNKAHMKYYSYYQNHIILNDTGSTLVLHMGLIPDTPLKVEPE